MKTAEVREIVRRELGPLKARLGVGDWKVRVGYRSEAADDDGAVARGRCTRLVDYLDASITLNPPALADEAEVLETLRHELFHVVLSPFDLYLSSVGALGLADDARAVLGRTRDHAVERAVIALERMYSGLVPAE